MKCLFSFFCTFIFLGLYASARKPQCDIDEEKQILTEVYFLSDTARWKGINWASDKPVIRWEGVKLTRKGCVRSLRVPDSVLNKEGYVNLQGLRKLRNIYIKGNPRDVERVHMLVDNFHGYPFMSRYSVYYNDLLFFRYGGFVNSPFFYDPFWYGYYFPSRYYYRPTRVIYRPSNPPAPPPVKNKAPNLKGAR